MVFTNDLPAPNGLRTDEFLLRPITAADAELDHDAVMESREYLRKWEQSTWPEDDFTVEANREDMAKLEQRHAKGEAFAYTVMNLDETECLGCVYLFPTDAPFIARADVEPIDGADWATHATALYFWVRKSRLVDELDRRLLDRLRSWLAEDWQIEDPLIVTNEQFEQQVAMFEGADLQLRFRLSQAGESGASLAYV